jgi:glycerol uptake facilitator-like aquaporin
MPSLRPLATAHRPTLTAIIGEFTGTFLFLLFAFLGASITASYSTTTPPLLTLLFVALAFALSLTANVWAFFRVTGAAFNPAVTVALFVVTPRAARSWVRSGGVIVAQLAGGIAAAAVAAGLVPGEGMPAVDTALGGGASVAQGLFIEMFLTAELVFVILMVGVEKHKGTFMAPAAVGTAFFLTQLVGELSRFSFFSALVCMCWIGLTGSNRHQLHGRLAQPRAQPRAGRRQRPVARVLLDLLCRARGRRVAGQRVLRAAAVSEVGGVQPGPGLG